MGRQTGGVPPPPPLEYALCIHECATRIRRGRVPLRRGSARLTGLLRRYAASAATHMAARARVSARAAVVDAGLEICAADGGAGTLSLPGGANARTSNTTQTTTSALEAARAAVVRIDRDVRATKPAVRRAKRAKTRPAAARFTIDASASATPAVRVVAPRIDTRCTAHHPGRSTRICAGIARVGHVGRITC